MAVSRARGVPLTLPNRPPAYTVPDAGSTARASTAASATGAHDVSEPSAVFQPARSARGCDDGPDAEAKVPPPYRVEPSAESARALTEPPAPAAKPLSTAPVAALIRATRERPEAPMVVKSPATYSDDPAGTTARTVPLAEALKPATADPAE